MDDEIEVVIALKGNDAVEILKSKRGIPEPDLEKAEKAVDSLKHDVMNSTIRKDRLVSVDPDDVDDTSPKKVMTSDGEVTAKRIDKVERIDIALQRLIIGRSVSFSFGNPVNYSCTPENDVQKAIKKAFNRILSDAKCDSFTRKIAKSIFTYGEVAEVWFLVEKRESHQRYGFATKFKLRCDIWSPKNGDKLYPYFDKTGDMVAFSRSYSIVDSTNKIHEYFETYTDDNHIIWEMVDSEYTETFKAENAIGCIPVVFGYQEELETSSVDRLIDRLEKLLSNFAETNDYHASPKIFVEGTLKGFAKKGEAGGIIEGEPGSTAKYLSWDNAPQSVKLEIDTLIKLIYTITQTPDISFDSVKGLGSVSGIALQLLFMDAHLKVIDKEEIFDPYLQRRANIIKAYLANMNSLWKDECDMIDIDPKMSPYTIKNMIEELDYWMAANGNQAIISQEESVQKIGITNDSSETYAKIKKEMKESTMINLGEPISITDE